MRLVMLGDADDGDEADIACLTYEILRVIDEAVSNGVSETSALWAVYDALELLEEKPNAFH